MTAIERIADTGRRVADRLARRGRVAVTAVNLMPTWHLHPAVARALEAATTHERPGDDERHPRVVVNVPGSAPFIAGDTDATAEALRARFPNELKTLDQAQVAAKFLADAQRQRVRARRPANGFVRNW